MDFSLALVSGTTLWLWTIDFSLWWLLLLSIISCWVQWCVGSQVAAQHRLHSCVFIFLTVSFAEQKFYTSSLPILSFTHSAFILVSKKSLWNELNQVAWIFLLCSIRFIIYTLKLVLWLLCITFGERCKIWVWVCSFIYLFVFGNPGVSALSVESTWNESRSVVSDSLRPHGLL